VCQEDAYLRELVRYIHLNPIRARIVSDLNELDGYDYCGHSALVGRKKRPWQGVDYVLSYFGQPSRRARKEYCSFIESGLDQGRRSELTGGGLIRSLGGWSQVRKGGLKGREHLKSDERILGDSNFVADVLSQAEEKFNPNYELRRLGYDLSRVVKRVAEICQLKEKDMLSKGKQQRIVKARSLLCFWAVRELGMSLTDLARYLGLSVPGVGYSVERGGIIAFENDYQLVK
jgi:putative transposase